MLKCAILDDYQDAAARFGDWSRLAGRVEITRFDHHLGGSQAVGEALAGYDIVVAMRERTRFDAQTLDRLSDLKLLVTTGPANASIDVAHARSRNILVCGTRGDRASTTQLTWGLILALARDIPRESQSVREGGWQTSVGLSLNGRCLGVVGLGNIGTQVARIGLAIGMDVQAWSPNLTKDKCAQIGVAKARSLNDLCSSSHVVSLHMTLADSTRNLLSRKHLRSFKSDAFLVNTSRAELIEEQALLEALRERWFAGAALDVFYREPLPMDSHFRRLPNVLATPHIGYVADRVYGLYYGDAIEAIERWVDGRDPIRVL